MPALTACSRASDHAAERVPAPTANTAPAPAAKPAPVATDSPALPFIEDDYERARAEAERRGVPLFVDVWASWCHTCLSMKQFVLPDPALQPDKDAFVWLAIDSEHRGNAAFLQRFPTRNLPTLWVIDGATQAPLLKWIGAATAIELHAVLQDTLRDRAAAKAASATDAAGSAEANALSSRGHAASASGDAVAAIDFYRRALEVAPKDWSKRPRTIEALSMRLAETDRQVESVELAAREAASMPVSTARLNVVLNGIDAASELPADAKARAALPELIRWGTEIAADPSPAVLLDDRSSLYLSLVSTLKEANPDESKRLAKTWSALLDARAAAETAPAARSVWDAHRVDAYLALGEAERAVPMLELSERERPTDYNPPARLARVYLTLQRLEPARGAIDRALARSDGPRKLRLYMLKADILVASADKPGARTVLREALDFARSANLPSQYDKLRQSIERRAQELT